MSPMLCLGSALDSYCTLIQGNSVILENSVVQRDIGFLRKNLL